MSEFFSSSDQSKQHFKNDFKAKKKIYGRLNTTPDANPNENYCILETAIIESMSTHLQEKIVKVLEKCTKKLIGHSRLAFNNHESNIDC